MLKTTRVVGVFLLLILVASVVSLSAANQPTSGTVTSVTDGDTFVLASGEKVRLAGINTPECNHPQKPVEYYSLQAKEKLRSLIEGQFVTLEYGAEKQGKYGRWLAFAYLKDGTFVNAELVRSGCAMAYLKYPCAKESQFLELELHARRQAIGMWASPGTASASVIEAATEAQTVKTQPAVKPEPAKTDAKKFWINSSSMKRHNRSCRWYGNTKRGYYTDEKVGSACGICGG